MICEKKSVKTYVKNYVIITISCFFYALSVSCFLDPNDMAPGGVTGIAMIVNRLVNIETGTLIMLINIPILFLGLCKFGLRFLVSTIYATMVSSIMTNFLAPYGAITKDPILACMIGSTIVSMSLGFIFKAGATTGGTDIIVKVLRIYFPHLKTGKLFMICDLIIVVISAFVFKNIDSALYAAIGVVLMGIVFDIILYGAEGAKLIYIISENWKTIATRMLVELDVGVTFLEGEGAYSNTKKRVIMCVVRKQISPRIEEIVKEDDPEAFMIISSAAEIYGEGYKSIFSEKM